MAKKRRGRSVLQVRDTFDIANLLTLPISRIDPSQLLREIEDRRTYHPEQAQRPARSLSGVTRHRLKAPQKHTRSLPIGVQFESPSSILICVRREKRREVLFAKRKTGKGHGRGRRRRTWYSDVQC